MIEAKRTEKKSITEEGKRFVEEDWSMRLRRGSEKTRAKINGK